MQTVLGFVVDWMVESPGVALTAAAAIAVAFAVIVVAILRPRRRGLLIGLGSVLAVALCVLTASVMAPQARLIAAAGDPVAAPAGPVVGGERGPGTDAMLVPRDQYITVVARDLLGRRRAEVSAVNGLQTQHVVGADAARQIRFNILPIAVGLASATKAYTFDDPALRTVHEHAVVAAAAHVEALKSMAVAFERDDDALLQKGNLRFSDGNREWAAWAGAILAQMKPAGGTATITYTIAPPPETPASGFDVLQATVAENRRIAV